MKSLPFFHGVDWDQLLNKQIKMPYIPNLASEADVSFFETTFTKERCAKMCMETLQFTFIDSFTYVCVYCIYVDRPVDSIIKMESDKADGKTKKKNKAGDLARSNFFIL